MALTIEQRRERCKYIGGSDCAAIFNISKWSTPLDIFFEKIQDEVDDEDTSNDAMEWGNKLEPLIIQTFQEKTGKECKIDNETLFHPKYKFIAANLDARLINENAILEVKTARFPGDWGDLASDQIPDPYLMQVAHYSAVMNLDKVYIAVLISGSDFRVYEYNKNPKLEDIIIQREVDFWNNHVLPKIPPTPSNALDALKLWKQAISGSIITANPDIADIVSEIKALKNQIKTLENLQNEHVTVLASFLKGSETLIDEKDRVLATWKSQNTNRFDLTRFKAENEELYNKYIKQSSTRVWRIK